MRSTKPKSDAVVTIDEVVGLRSWGLIIYGILPANLAFLGPLTAKIESDNPAWLLTSLVPIVLIFMLIRARQQVWYLTNRYLNTRSGIITLMIVILSTVVCGASLVLKEPNALQFGQNFEWIIFQKFATKAFLLAVASFVVSSTLFMASMTKTVDLPGLPSSQCVVVLDNIRIALRAIQSSSIWQESPSASELTKLKSTAEEMAKRLETAQTFTGNILAKRSILPMNMQVRSLIDKVDDLMQAGSEAAKNTTWKIYFAPETSLTDAEQSDRKRNLNEFLNIRELARLPLGL